jgi:hypothetical protein
LFPIALVEVDDLEAAGPVQRITKTFLPASVIVERLQSEYVVSEGLQ